MAACIDWTPEIIRSLRALWHEGLSTAAIGARLGMSKNAVVGKAHRLNLAARRSPIRPGARRARTERLPSAPVDLTANVPVVIPPRPIAPSALPPPPVPRAFRQGGALACSITAEPRGDNRCCWPIGDPGSPDFRFCGNTSRRNAPYCDEHCSLAYVPRTPRHPPSEGDDNEVA